MRHSFVPAVATANIFPTARQCARGYDTAHLEDEMKKIIQCPCGSIIEGENDEDVVKKAQEHAKATHGMDLSRDQALAMARPA